MKTGLRKIRRLTAMAALLLSSRCGPTTVVARLVTPAAAAPPPTATATPRFERPTAPPPAKATAAPLPSATPTVRPAALQAPSAPAATPTAARRATASPTRTMLPATLTSTPALVPVTRTAPPTATPSQLPTQPPAPPARTPVPPSPARAAPSPSSLGPASAATTLPGEWDFRADAGKGIIAGTLRFRSTPSGLAGLYIGLHGNATELSNLRTTGSGVSFDLVTPTAVWHLDGTVSGDSIDGTFRTADRQIRWTALRKPVLPAPTPKS